MGKRKKDVKDMTTEELARHVFPKKVVEELERIAHEGEEQEEKPDGKPKSS